MIILHDYYSLADLAAIIAGAGLRLLTDLHSRRPNDRFSVRTGAKGFSVVLLVFPARNGILLLKIGSTHRRTPLRK